jgi:hypothetical protein
MEQETVHTEKLPGKVIERVTLGKEEADKVAAWLKQIEESSKGFLILSRADIVNFIIRNYRAVLSAKEIQQVRVHHYDPIRHLNWITPRLKDALERNDVSLVVSLQEEIRSIELSVIAKPDADNKSSEGAPVVPDLPKKRPKREKILPSQVVDRDTMKEEQNTLPEA